ncbi:translation initiation factor IF-3 [Candidatus Uhrbacteria bacterium]|nr:translation initiation factor IF-3 [Candidatus Uhrbacteria bacterium]
MRKSQYRFKRLFEKPKELFLINEKITALQVQVIDEDGNNVGVLPTAQAIQLARSKELDLVEVFPKANPPVAKILDYGQFKYWKEKEARKQKAHQHQVDIKGVRLSLRIGAHDLDMRRTQALRFLEQGDKVRAEIILRGRERQQTEMAVKIIRDFIAGLGTGIRVDQDITKQAGKISMIVYGNPAAQEADQDTHEGTAQE